MWPSRPMTRAEWDSWVRDAELRDYQIMLALVRKHRRPRVKKA